MPELPPIGALDGSVASDHAAQSIDPRLAEAARLEAAGMPWSARDLRREVADAHHAAQRKAVERDVESKDRLHATLRRNFGVEFADEALSEQ